MPETLPALSLVAVPGRRHVTLDVHRVDHPVSVHEHRRAEQSGLRVDVGVRSAVARQNAGDLVLGP